MHPKPRSEALPTKIFRLPTRKEDSESMYGEFPFVEWRDKKASLSALLVAPNLYSRTRLLRRAALCVVAKKKRAERWLFLFSQK
jgi:hypothetical protein